MTDIRKRRSGRARFARNLAPFIAAVANGLDGWKAVARAEVRRKAGLQLVDAVALTGKLIADDPDARVSVFPPPKRVKGTIDQGATRRAVQRIVDAALADWDRLRPDYRVDHGLFTQPAIRWARGSGGWKWRATRTLLELTGRNLHPAKGLSVPEAER